VNRSLFLALFVLPALLAAPLWAVPEPTDDELKANRASLDEWRKHPEQLRRLRSDLKAFLKLPEARREQLLKFDLDLREQPAAAQARLMNLLERYTLWLEHLPESDRQTLEAAADKTARLAIIRALRDEEYMRTQPRTVRAQWKALAPPAQADFIRKTRQEERQRRQEWQVARRFWKQLTAKQVLPARSTDFDERDREGINEYLVPLLSNDERERLKKAEGQWPAYTTILVELADKHPLALPTDDGPRYLNKLPRALQKRFALPIPNPFAGGQSLATYLKPAEGKWPDFPRAVTTVNKQFQHVLKSPLPRELWASGYASLLDPMKEYVDKSLKPVLTDREAQDLASAEGNWPEYPLEIQKLAQRHELPRPPWETALSGPPERWADYRAVNLSELPEVSRQALRDFALYKIDPQERAKLKLNPRDPKSWQRLIESFHREAKKHHENHEHKKDAPSSFFARPSGKRHDD
jgi:hypothetical protein